MTSVNVSVGSSSLCKPDVWPQKQELLEVTERGAGEELRDSGSINSAKRRRE
jgi:hypothetical protein